MTQNNFASIDKDIWVFGYASLMWKPNFPHIDSQPAQLFGYHRALCVYSFLYRGTSERPGLVAGLLPGGSCKGVAFRVSAKNWDTVFKYLQEREMVYDVYSPKWMHATIKDQKTTVFGYVANPQNKQYAGHLTDDEIAGLISNGEGISGTGIEYLENTLAHLETIGIRDAHLETILKKVRE